MRKALSLMLVLTLIFMLCGCKVKKEQIDDKGAPVQRPTMEQIKEAKLQKEKAALPALPKEKETDNPQPKPQPEPQPEPQVSDFVKVPVLMYHHLSESGKGPYTISFENFKAHLDTLKNNNYNTISLKQLLNYVENGEGLPENPIIISFDDGYLSNYEMAYPMLKQRQMNAVIFAIGHSIGSTFEDSSNTNARINYIQAFEMSKNGIEVQSHTFNMHKSPTCETDPTRKGVSKLNGETDEHHFKALNEDFALAVSTLSRNTGQNVFALSYPYGIYNDASEKASAQNGIKMTFTSVYGISTIEKNNPDSLRLIKRLLVDDCTAEELLEIINANAY